MKCLIILLLIFSCEEISGPHFCPQKEGSNTKGTCQLPPQRQSSAGVDDGSLLTRVNSEINTKEEDLMSINWIIKEGTAKQHFSTVTQRPVITDNGYDHQVSGEEMMKSEVPTKSLMTKRRYSWGFGYRTKCIPMKLKKCQIFKVNGLVKDYCVTYATVMCTALDWTFELNMNNILFIQ